MFRLKSGFEIPKIGLGTYLAHGEELYNAVDHALKAGYRSFDTAKFYKNEKDLGDALKHLLPKYNLITTDIFITTKVFPYTSKTTVQLHNDIEQSLMHLGRTYLDLVLVHYPRAYESDDQDPMNKTHRCDVWQGLESLNKSKVIRSIGVSNYEIRHIEEMKNYATVEPCVNQVEFHPHFQREPLKTYCKQHGILLQAFSPIGRQNKQLLEDPTLVSIARSYNTSTPAIILAWAMQEGVGVVPKSVTAQRIAENYSATKLAFTDPEMKEINRLNRDQPYVEDNGWLCR